MNNCQDHVCGLAGYNGMIDPPCPGCETRRAALAAPSAQPPEHYAMLQMLQECKEYLQADPSTVGGRQEADRLVKRIEETMKGQQ